LELNQAIFPEIIAATIGKVEECCFIRGFFLKKKIPQGTLGFPLGNFFSQGKNQQETQPIGPFRGIGIFGDNPPAEPARVNTTIPKVCTLQGTNISHLGKFGKPSSKVIFDGIC